MSTSRFCIEEYMDEMDLKYFYREELGVPSWLLFFSENAGLLIRLAAEGEFLMLRSLPLINLKGLPENEQINLAKQLLKRNNSLMFGHYSADETVVFETSLPIEDAELTRKQLACWLSVFSAEIGYFHDQQKEFRSGQTVNPIDHLMRRLIDGDETKAE